MTPEITIEPEAYNRQPSPDCFSLFGASRASHVPPPPGVNLVTVNGLPIANMTIDDAVLDIVHMALEPRPHQVCFVDSQGAALAHTDVDYRNALLGADRIWASGEGLRLASGLFSPRLTEDLTARHILEPLCAALRDYEISLYLLGGKPGSADCLRLAIESCFPGIPIVGARSAYFPPQDEPGIIEDIAGSQADILLAGLGMPREDLWIAQNLPDLGVRVAIGAGSLYDVSPFAEPDVERFCFADVLLMFHSCIWSLRGG